VERALVSEVEVVEGEDRRLSLDQSSEETREAVEEDESRLLGKVG
jgi:hypothetical protein